VIFPRLNRSRATRSRMPPSVWLPSLDIFNSSILISELLEGCCSVPGTCARLSHAPSIVRTELPPGNRVSGATGRISVCSSTSETTGPCTESTVAATCLVVPFQQPLARLQQNKKKEISTGNRNDNKLYKK